MALSIYSKFYYIEPVRGNNQFANFTENGVDILTAEIPIKEYTLTDLMVAVETALNTAGDNEYQVTLDRVFRTVTITSNANFEILAGTGPQVGNDVWPTLGFNQVDTGTDTEHASDSSIGVEFIPQFYLQDYIRPDQFQEAVSGVRATSANGRNTEVVSFGNQKFIEMNMKYQNSLNIVANPIRKSSTGYEDVRDFLIFATKARPMEFMENKDLENDFITVILESTPTSQNGLGFRLEEQLSEELPLFYQTGKLKFRIID